MTAHFIGDSPETGVIDPYQRLYCHPGISVCDGSTLSANLGVNPSLSITAQAERAMAFWPPTDSHSSGARIEAMTVHLATTANANELLARDPFALLVGMLLDQQIPMEKAFTSPHVLAERMGVATLDPRQIADFDPEKFEAFFREVPALHRFPAAMAKRVQELARAIVAQYDGDTEAIWSTARSGNELVSRIAGLPGFGEQKAKIFTALLGKQFGIRPRAWRQAAGHYGEQGSYRSVADVVDDESLGKVRAFKKQMKATAAQTT